MINWFKSIFRPPQPSGPPEMVRAFRTSDHTLTQDVITVNQDEWVVDVQEGQTIRLFEVANTQAEQCVLTYRAMLKSESLSGRAFLEMWCRFPGRGEFFSKGLDQTVKGTTDWASNEVSFYLKKGERPDLIKLNLVVEGSGKALLRDVQLLKTPFTS